MFQPLDTFHSRQFPVIFACLKRPISSNAALTVSGGSVVYAPSDRMN